MMTVLGCITNNHNLWLVIVAALVCATGSWAILRLFDRAASTAGLQRVGWHFLTAVAAGSSIWCTHFIAMLAYDPGVPVGFDPVLTVVSLLIAMLGALLGFLVAASGLTRLAPAVGGGIVGLAIVTMHYTGMMAYRVQGIVSWNMAYLSASIILSVAFSAVALHIAMRQIFRGHKYVATGVLVIAIVSLHFTGITAFRVSPMLIDGSFSNPAALQALALAIAGVALVIVGTGLSSYLIDDDVRADSYERLRHMALNDSLTGLPNRASFNERLDQEIALARGAGGKVALIGIDLDRFKEINDLRGHSVGDEVLRILSRRMINLLREGEFVARLGGDEFAAVHRLRNQADLLDFLSRLEAALTKPIRLDDYEVIPGASIGVAIYPDNADSTEVLISNADLAMYRAKADITREVCFYKRSMDETVRARRNLASELREAIENNQLDVHYQVQTSISTGEIRGYEALLRWEHPQHGFIPPSEFIPLAEENGLILQMGEWVLRTACAKAATWEPQYKVAVNLSPVQFVHTDLSKLVLEVLIETGLSPDRLELELTESTIFTDKERALHMLRQIKALGVSIALDDFGTGYSSLDTLRAFPFDKIKLDRSFMSEIESSPQAKAIIRAVLALGKSLEIPVLAEGIETQDQLTLLTTEGCDEAQGFFLGRPAPLHRIVTSGQITLTTREPLKMIAKMDNRERLALDLVAGSA
ncbi:putative bifunctional diguanylate cyclase/phosphodiesterase [Rhizobium leguminosarum]|uniref:putative bifunctional diguanylate cyclase/phosphodiesterase n=1 Tax=Rhizobium leguminosarum TaxID=384 RepID=UPI0013DA689B|nr:bifunctional diguanylate cyclase/phosphodiesterase [Rhizobium leguminosarum]NEK37392.1 EAL domain-containing protein [Rhizobium leguminosarum]